MNKEDYQEKIMIITALATNFNADIDKNLLKIWLGLLQEYDSKLVSQACVNVIKSFEYKTLPPFAVIQKELDKLTGNTEEAKRNIPHEAWREVELALEICPDKEKVPELSARAAHALQRVGGWRKLCITPASELKWIKRDFLQICDNSLDVPLEYLESSNQLATGIFIKALSGKMAVQ